MFVHCILPPFFQQLLHDIRGLCTGLLPCLLVQELPNVDSGEQLGSSSGENRVRVLARVLV